MAASTHAPVVRRPGGRNAAVGGRVAEAVLTFLGLGDTDFGVAEVAERAGVHRSTVYRRWPTRAALVREGLSLHNSRLRIPNTGDYRRDLRELAEALAAFFSNPVELSLNALVFQSHDSELSSIAAEFWLPVMAELEGVVQRAIDRGEISPKTRRSIATDLLTAAVLVPTQFERRAPSREFLRDLADWVYLASDPT
jgi:AcrR family transcriptional regulator